MRHVAPWRFAPRQTVRGVPAEGGDTVRMQQTEQGTHQRWAGVTGDEGHEAFAALVRQLMADCRARLAAEDGARELARDGQEAAAGVVERPAADEPPVRCQIPHGGRVGCPPFLPPARWAGPPDPAHRRVERWTRDGCGPSSRERCYC